MNARAEAYDRLEGRITRRDGRPALGRPRLG